MLPKRTLSQLMAGLLLVSAAACLACRAPGGSAPGTVSTAALRGLDPAAVRRLLGEPQKIERVASATAPGAGYERWTFAGNREVVFLDGKVLDALP